MIFPNALKILIYRHIVGYRIGHRVRIGFSLIDVEDCEIGDRTNIGHFNVLCRVKRLEIGADVKIGLCNLIIGGDRVTLGDGALIARFNEINSILNPLASNPCTPELKIGRHAVITASHKIDFTDRVEIGDHAVIAGRNSNIWTHNRQQVKPVKIGARCYVGSGIQMAPGSAVGPSCVVGLGSVITRHMTSEFMLIAGVPAKEVKPLDDEARVLVRYPTRPDLEPRQVST